MTKPASTLSHLERKIRFARKHWRAMGEPFEILDGGWLLEQYWRPLHSFRLTAIDKSALCAKCAGSAGQLVETYAKPSPHAECAGIRCEPIQFVLLDLPRRSGKTVGTSGYVGASLFRGEGERIGFISGSEDQSGRLFADHYRTPIMENSALLKRARITGTKIEAWKTASDMRKGKQPSCQFTFMATSLSGTTGGKLSVLVIDEARAVPADIASSLIPSMWDSNGWHCARGVSGHTKTKGDLDDPNHPEKCATCSGWLQPYTGKVLAMSSAGELTGGLRDWFWESVELQEKEPSPRFHVYRAQGVVNRKVAESSVNATAAFFGKVESMRDFIEIETSNTARRRGEDFLTNSDIAACVDSKLLNRESGERPGVAFLDTSDVVELTSLVVVEDDTAPAIEGAEPEPAWSRVVVSHIHVWDPKKLGRIEAAPLEEYLGKLVPVFKLLRLRIDDRHAPWVRNMVARLKKLPWGRIVVGCTEYSREDRRFAWNALEARVLGKTIRIPDNATLRKELRAARKSYDLDGRMDVREESRRLRHLDVAESLAGCCFDVHALATRPNGPSFADVQKRGLSIAERMKRLAAASTDVDPKRPLTRGYGPNSY